MPQSQVDTRTTPGTCGKHITFSDSVDVLLQNNMYPRYFIPDADGTVSVIMGDDTSNATPVPIVVKAGLVYSGSFKRFRTTGSATVTGVSVFG